LFFQFGAWYSFTVNIKALIALFLLPGIAVASLSGLLFQGCLAAHKNPVNDISAIKSYMDIPGITAGEIAAIEAYKASGRSFTYGSLKSMEAFHQQDGSNAGFSVMVCEFLSGLFGMPFT
jgi:hypothetical protein